jgi:hypothetical protein
MIDHAGVKVSDPAPSSPDGHNVEAVCHEASGARGATR